MSWPACCRSAAQRSDLEAIGPIFSGKMVRISIPTITPHPHPLPPSALTLLPVKEAAQHLSEFLTAGKGRTLVLTGAGVSVDSGIRAYRGKEGHYSNPNYQSVESGVTSGE